MITNNTAVCRELKQTNENEFHIDRDKILSLTDTHTHI